MGGCRDRVFQPSPSCGAYSYDSTRWKCKVGVEQRNHPYRPLDLLGLPSTPQPGRFSISRSSRRPMSCGPTNTFPPPPALVSVAVVLRPGYTGWVTRSVPNGQARRYGQALEPNCRFPSTRESTPGFPVAVQQPEPGHQAHALPVRQSISSVPREWPLEAAWGGWTTRSEQKASALLSVTPSLGVQRPLDGPYFLSLRDLDRAPTRSHLMPPNGPSAQETIFSPYYKNAYSTGTFTTDMKART